MALPAKIYIVNTENRRQSARLSIERGSTLRTDSSPLDVIMTDLSETGFAIEAALALEIGAEVSIGLAGFGTFEALVVRKDGNIAGCAFLQPIDAHIVRNAFEGANVVHAHTLEVLPKVEPGFPQAGINKAPRVYRALAVLASATILWTLIVLAVRLEIY